MASNDDRILLKEWADRPERLSVPIYDSPEMYEPCIICGALASTCTGEHNGEQEADPFGT